MSSFVLSFSWHRSQLLVDLLVDVSFLHYAQRVSFSVETKVLFVGSSSIIFFFKSPQEETYTYQKIFCTDTTKPLRRRAGELQKAQCYSRPPQVSAIVELCFSIDAKSFYLFFYLINTKMFQRV